MPIVIFYANGNRDVVKGSSWRALDESSKFGTIYLTGLADGVKMAVNKAQVVKVIEFTDEEWEALRVKEEAEHRTQLLQQRAQEYSQKQAEFAAWEKRPLLKRLFRHNPVVVPPNPAHMAPKVTVKQGPNVTLDVQQGTAPTPPPAAEKP